MKRVNSFFWVLFPNKQLKSNILKLKFQDVILLVSFHKHRLLTSVSSSFQPSSVSPVHSEQSQGSGQWLRYLWLHLLLSSDLSAPVSSPLLCWANTFQLNKENHPRCASLYSNTLSYSIIVTVVGLLCDSLTTKSGLWGLRVGLCSFSWLEECQGDGEQSVGVLW